MGGETSVPSREPLAEGAFPDEAHLRQLRDLLWVDDGRGRASVMIGSGMSRNAVPLSAGIPPMPLWGELATRMAKSVWPSEQARRPADSLVVAEYFERMHKRAALDDFLKAQVRDNEFQPGRLHVLLMALPWADVFTTNYDTLLEKAARLVLERRYEVVVNSSDLSWAKSPRIVKLHGSFPSQRPLIITQEDFRTYPVRFAPFVNTVQQSVMETALCLIGFSGDDPNFLAWTGWVRDNLGEAAPPIYHCGVLDLDIARRSYYEARNIRPIDLGPLFPKSKWNDSVRRSSAIEWLILSLAEGAPLDADGWPTIVPKKPGLPLSDIVKQRAVHKRGRRRGRVDADDRSAMPRIPGAWEPTAGLPSVLSAQAPVHSDDIGDAEPEQALHELAVLRTSYPGWLIAPSGSVLPHMVSEWFTRLSKPTWMGRVDVLEAMAWVLSLVNWPWDDAFVGHVEHALSALNSRDYEEVHTGLLKGVAIRCGRPYAASAIFAV